MLLYNLSLKFSITLRGVFAQLIFERNFYLQISVFRIGRVAVINFNKSSPNDVFLSHFQLITIL